MVEFTVMDCDSIDENCGKGMTSSVYYSIENILKPDFGKRICADQLSWYDRQVCIGRKGSKFNQGTHHPSEETPQKIFKERDTLARSLAMTTLSPNFSTNESPLKNSMQFLENFFKTNYKFVNGVEESGIADVRLNVSPPIKISIPDRVKSSSGEKFFRDKNFSGCRSPEGTKNRVKRTTAVTTVTSLSKASLVMPPNPIPAWIFCTRYSDRPSSGIRIKRKSKKKATKPDVSSPTYQDKEPKIFEPLCKPVAPHIQPNTNPNNTNCPSKAPEFQYITDENSGDSNFGGAQEDSLCTDPNKRPRTAFSHSQLHRLRKEFNANPYLTEYRRKDLAKLLDLKESQIKIWFQNKRAKLKKKKCSISETYDQVEIFTQSHHPATNSNASEAGTGDPVPDKLDRDGSFKKIFNSDSINETSFERIKRNGDEEYIFTDDETEEHVPQEPEPRKKYLFGRNDYKGSIMGSSTVSSPTRSESPLTLLDGKFASNKRSSSPYPSEKPKRLLTLAPNSPISPSSSVKPSPIWKGISKTTPPSFRNLMMAYPSPPGYVGVSPYTDRYPPEHFYPPPFLNLQQTTNKSLIGSTPYDNFYYLWPFLPEFRPSTINANGTK